MLIVKCARAGWLLGVAVCVLTTVTPASGGDKPGEPLGQFPDISYQVQTGNGAALTVIPASRWDLSPPLRELIKIPSTLNLGSGEIEVENRTLPKYLSGVGETTQGGTDPVLQDGQGTEAMPAPSASWDGINNLDGVVPADPTGAVGPSHYVQWVNLHLAIWTKSGTLVWGPNPGNVIWSGFGGPCDGCNDGDPIVLYDKLANRWLISQFANTSSSTGPFYQYVAISQTSDPTGSWYRYAFTWPGNKLNDYPKFGVWPDGYYMTANQFAVPAMSWAGAGVAVMDRASMLSGLPASIQYFNLYSVDINFGGMLPSDLDGPAPPAGTPAYFGEVDDSSTIGPDDAFRVWEFHTDWTTPANTTFGLSGQPNAVLPVAPFTPLCPLTASCIPQPATAMKLAGIGDRLMYRLQYRSFAGYRTLLANHSVDAGSGTAGVRWYELRNGGSGWSIYQQGTFSPDMDSRWMGSIAMNKSGDIAAGYSVSSPGVYPSIRYAGRLATDPLGVLSQGETTLVAGAGSQTGASRWGDYSTLTLDPTDDCTFWYTQEYMGATSAAGWKTRIGSFQLPCCITPGAPTIGTVTVPANNQLTVSWTPGSPAGITYNIYRSTGACPGGAYALVKLGQPSSPWTDTTVSGGVTYSYQVAAVETTGMCESSLSGCAYAAATGSCIVAPTFGGLATVTAPSAATCGLVLGWAAGSSGCPGGSITYNIYRNTSAAFIPGPATLVATGISGATTSYSDFNGLSNGATYYYIVRAVDSINGMDDGNFTTNSGTPLGLLASLSYASPDVPKPIPDNNLTGVTSTITVAGNPDIVVDVNVTVDITHTWDGDLRLSLISPTAVTIPLSTNRGGSGHDYAGTVFDDSAATAISAGTPPFTGSFRPESPLTAVNGIPANGIWRLLVVDAAAVDTGTLTGWSLQITTVTACGTVLPPGEAAPGSTALNGQTWSSDKGTLIWPALPGATSYTVYRGTPAQLPDLLTASTDSCTRYSGASTSVAVAETPSAGSFNWYLVTAGNAAGSGTAGNATAGARVVNISGSCP